MESLERFEQNHRVIEEFAAQWLAPIAGDIGRLCYVSDLRNVSTGRYSHPPLEQAYSQPAVHEALLCCHEELFEKVLEQPLQQQERDLRAFLAGIDSPAEEIARRWQEVEFFRQLVPFGAPHYLRDLFLSNLRIILDLVVGEGTKIRTAA